ncbi:CsbD family protein [Rhodococcus sp. IEGM 1409]|uniref:CsbD family protein n=1 Tax=Rhodococcus sp. IEGM 1409 TaxID=3047082 RepID=UPI0024B87580|nr:CsbD family protein [Rhodococcus sp. IEGM 1409]MDI9902317.1 CsbD family protein [Rhodococcus sp. IEGM 1409]
MSDFIDKAKHRAEDLIGEAKEKFGNATGNDDLAAEGVADQGEAKIKKAGDAVSDKVSDIKDKFTS